MTTIAWCKRGTRIKRSKQNVSEIGVNSSSPSWYNKIVVCVNQEIFVHE